MRHRTVAAVLSAVLIGALAGCVEEADYEERIAYLRKVAQQGADTHALIASQEAVIDKARCERAYEGTVDIGDAPAITGTGDEEKAWAGQIKEFYVDSCVSGKPKPAPGDPALMPTGSSSVSPVPSSSA